MKNFKFSYKSIAVVAVIITLGFALGFRMPKEKEVPVQAQSGGCEIGDVVLDTDVFCWAVDAVNFVIQNELFSVLNPEDTRDAVKHYRFYRLVMSELNQ